MTDRQTYTVLFMQSLQKLNEMKVTMGRLCPSAHLISRTIKQASYQGSTLQFICWI